MDPEQVFYEPGTEILFFCRLGALTVIEVDSIVSNRTRKKKKRQRNVGY